MLLMALMTRPITCHWRVSQWESGRQGGQLMGFGSQKFLVKFYEEGIHCELGWR